MEYYINNIINKVGETLKDTGTSESDICKFLLKYNYSIEKNIVPNNYIFYLQN